jgi:hypothetical protein
MNLKQGQKVGGGDRKLKDSYLLVAHKLPSDIGVGLWHEC